MKLLLIVSIAILSSINIYSQELKYSDLGSSVRPQGPFKIYVSKDGTVYQVGDTLKLGFPSSNKTFAFIRQGDGVLVAPQQLTASFSGTKSEIKNIIIGGTKRSGFMAMVRGKSMVGITTYTIQLENALESGEIKRLGMTSEEALIELKRNKDKLDLGLINQEKYDSLKSVLVKYIK